MYTNGKLCQTLSWATETDVQLLRLLQQTQIPPSITGWHMTGFGVVSCTEQVRQEKELGEHIGNLEVAHNSEPAVLVECINLGCCRWVALDGMPNDARHEEVVVTQVALGCIYGSWWRLHFLQGHVELPRQSCTHHRWRAVISLTLFTLATVMIHRVLKDIPDLQHLLYGDDNNLDHGRLN